VLYAVRSIVMRISWLAAIIAFLTTSRVIGSIGTLITFKANYEVSVQVDC